MMSPPPCFLLLLALPLLLSPPALASNKLPDDYPLCKKAEASTCLKSAVQEALLKLADGIPALGVPSIDPLEVATLEIGQGQGPVSINQKFSGIRVYGLSKAVIEVTRPDLANYVLAFDGHVDTSLEADYELDGRILLLPVTGKGRCKLIFTNLQATVAPVGKEKVKNGKKYWDVNGFNVTISGLDRLQVHFDNLFNGDKTLGETMNALMNQNWEELWKELRPAFEETFGIIFHQFSKRIFDKVPFDDIFLD